MVMGLSEARIDLNRVTVLDGGFAEFPFFKVALPAFKILLLADVGVARATGEQHGRSDEQEKCTKCQSTPHGWFSRDRRAKRRFGLTRARVGEFCTRVNRRRAMQKKLCWLAHCGM